MFSVKGGIVVSPSTFGYSLRIALFVSITSVVEAILEISDTSSTDGVVVQ